MHLVYICVSHVKRKIGTCILQLKGFFKERGVRRLFNYVEQKHILRYFFSSINDKKKKKKKSDPEYLQLGSCKELLQLLISVIMGDNFDGLT